MAAPLNIANEKNIYQISQSYASTGRAAPRSASLSCAVNTRSGAAAIRFRVGLKVAVEPLLELAAV
jgi:hypothetical protein